LDDGDDTVRCLALPIAGEQLLVPNAVVAEVLAADSVTLADGGPEWLLGNLTWRGSVLPLVCMEAALGGARLEVGARSKVVVINALSGDESLKNYAVLIQGIPHQVLATDHTVALDTPVNGARPFVAADLQVEGERAFIPDLDAVEKALLDVADEWQVPGPSGALEDGID
jgi:chemosensory pili system protein ChpC